jgi:hypothetical protein
MLSYYIIMYKPGHESYRIAKTAMAANEKRKEPINSVRSSHLITSMHAYVCQHCGQYIYKVEMHQNSQGAFIHGTLRSTGLPIHHNTSRQTCDNYVKYNKIRGCGRVCVLPKS